MTYPIATLREFVSDDGTFPSREDILAAIAELERRARIEARRDAWLASNALSRTLSHEIDCDGIHTVTLMQRVRHAGVFWSAEGPDYWTALEAALNAAGAP